MPRPRYRAERDEDKGQVHLFSPSGEKIISTYTTMGSEKFEYIDHVGLDLPDEKIGNNHDKLFEYAMAAHERMTTTRWRRFQYAIEDSLTHPAWAVIAAIAATVAAIGVFFGGEK